eukprot:15167-Hanusia_phi.AAC.3
MKPNRTCRDRPITTVFQLIFFASLEIATQEATHAPIPTTALAASGLLARPDVNNIAEIATGIVHNHCTSLELKLLVVCSLLLNLGKYILYAL